MTDTGGGVGGSTGGSGAGGFERSGIGGGGGNDPHFLSASRSGGQKRRSSSSTQVAEDTKQDTAEHAEHAARAQRSRREDDDRMMGGSSSMNRDRFWSGGDTKTGEDDYALLRNVMQQQQQHQQHFHPSAAAILDHSFPLPPPRWTNSGEYSDMRGSAGSAAESAASTGAQAQGADQYLEPWEESALHSRYQSGSVSGPVTNAENAAAYPERAGVPMSATSLDVSARQPSFPLSTLSSGPSPAMAAATRRAHQDYQRMLQSAAAATTTSAAPEEPRAWLDAAQRQHSFPPAAADSSNLRSLFPSTLQQQHQHSSMFGSTRGSDSPIGQMTAPWPQEASVFPQPQLHNQQVQYLLRQQQQQQQQQSSTDLFGPTGSSAHQLDFGSTAAQLELGRLTSAAAAAGTQLAPGMGGSTLADLALGMGRSGQDVYSSYPTSAISDPRSFAISRGGDWLLQEPRLFEQPRTATAAAAAAYLPHHDRRQFQDPDPLYRPLLMNALSQPLSHMAGGDDHQRIILSPHGRGRGRFQLGGAGLDDPSTAPSFFGTSLPLPAGPTPASLTHVASMMMGSAPSAAASATASYPGPDNVHQPAAPQLGGLYLPRTLAHPDDKLILSCHQVLLRHQIEVFSATEADTITHTRGRNKPVRVGQVGIRCKHCANIPSSRRQKGSLYFPATTMGIYQASQNMSTTHLQCGLCSEMPDSLKEQFAALIPSKVTGSLAGRPYWAKSAREMGLIDTEDGIRFLPDMK